MRTALKRAAVHVALVAMVLRALLPTGWMPSTQEHHASPIMLCPGMDHMAMPMPGEPAHKADHAKHSVCIFAAAAPLSTPATDLIAMPTFAVGDAAVAPARASFVSIAAYRAFAARAPPSLA